MRRIFRSEDVVKIAEAVRIPDCTVRIEPHTLPESTLLSDRDEHSEEQEKIQEAPVLTDDDADEEIIIPESTVEEKISAAKEELRALELQIESEREKLFIERDAILKKANSDAAEMIESARQESLQILDEAKTSADKVLAEAREKGYAEGVEAKQEEITACLDNISRSLEELKSDQDEFFDEYAGELRFLALEIAEKILAQKLECDEKILFPLVRSAVKTLRDVSWIKVEVSDKLRSAAAELEAFLAEVKPAQSIELELRRDADIGTCVVHTAEGVIVASVLTQIENIHSYFEQYKESDENEREA